MSALFRQFEPHPGPPPAVVAGEPCEHIRLRYVYRDASNGVRTYGYQCRDCGERLMQSFLGADRAAKEHQLDPSEAAPVNDHVGQELAARWSAYMADNSSLKRQTFFSWYNRYLKTREWQEKRHAALSRDKFKCCECGADAEHVHHLSYSNVGFEPLEDLMSVCRPCHAKLHGRFV